MWEPAAPSWVAERFGPNTLLRDQLGLTKPKKPLSKKELAKDGLCYDPLDIADATSRELLKNYRPDFLPLNAFQFAMSLGLPVNVVRAKNSFGKQSKELYWKVTEEGIRMFAESQPFKAHLFGVDVNHYKGKGWDLVKSVVRGKFEACEEQKERDPESPQVDSATINEECEAFKSNLDARLANLRDGVFRRLKKMIECVVGRHWIWISCVCCQEKEGRRFQVVGWQSKESHNSIAAFVCEFWLIVL